MLTACDGLRAPAADEQRLRTGHLALLTDVTDPPAEVPADNLRGNSVTESKFCRISSKMRSALCVSGGSLAMSVTAAAPGDDKERKVDTIERGRTCLNYATRCNVP